MKVTAKPFRLDRILKIREHQRDLRRQALSLIEEEHLACLDQLRRFDEQLREHCLLWRKAQNAASIDANQLVLFSQTQDRLLRDRRQKEEELTEIQTRLTEARTLFDEAVREVRVLEKLKEKKAEENRRDNR
ncbi:MAG: hypothetical protein IJH68_13455 [Thermoguttaceae bacterium]|nr:hypothetical protein [Thermoguttaceae bacterium]